MPNVTSRTQIYERSKVVLYGLLTILTGMVAVICVAGQYFAAPVFLEGHGPCFVRVILEHTHNDARLKLYNSYAGWT